MSNKIVKTIGIKYFLFDVDGLLVDSERIFNICWREGAKAQGYNLTFEQALQLRSCDSKLAKSLFVEWFNDEDAYTKVRAARKELMADVKKYGVPSLKPGINDILAKLNAKGIKYAIVSSSPVSRCRKYLEDVGILEKFKIIISAEMVDRGKPYPEIYTFACSQLGVSPNECVSVEDSPNGLRSAHAAGCTTIMIPDLSPYNEEDKEYVDYHFSSLADIQIC